MVEVFKTNVTSVRQARELVVMIESCFEVERVNFDLEDCDRILRIEVKDHFDIDSLINLLRRIDVKAEVLPDTLHLLNSKVTVR
jgi:hypothetical protein